MKTAFITTLLGLGATFAAATPIDVVRRQAAPSSSFALASSGFASPTGTAALAPTGTAGSVPLSTGTVCSPNGALVCNGPSQFGICNWGRVTFQAVAAGTQCQDGKIVPADS